MCNDKACETGEEFTFACRVSGLDGPSRSFSSSHKRVSLTYETFSLEEDAPLIGFKAYKNSFGDTDKLQPIIKTKCRPSAPRNLRELAATLSSISIQWDAHSYEGDSGILQNRVYANAGGNDAAFIQIGTTDSNTRLFTTTGIAPGQTFRFKMAAENAEGIGVQSAKVKILAPEDNDSLTLSTALAIILPLFILNIGLNIYSH